MKSSITLFQHLVCVFRRVEVVVEGLSDQFEVSGGSLVLHHPRWWKRHLILEIQLLMVQLLSTPVISRPIRHFWGHSSITIVAHINEILYHCVPIILIILTLVPMMNHHLQYTSKIIWPCFCSRHVLLIFIVTSWIHFRICKYFYESCNSRTIFPEQPMPQDILWMTHQRNHLHFNLRNHSSKWVKWIILMKLYCFFLQIRLDLSRDLILETNTFLSRPVFHK